MSDQQKPSSVQVEAGRYKFEQKIEKGKTKSTFLVEKDTPFDVIQKLDREGVFLRWSIKPDEFRQLDEGELDKLGTYNRSAYVSFLEAAVDEARREKNNEAFQGLPKVFGRRHSSRDAQKKLDIGQAIPGRRVGWKRPDELAERAEEGWRVARKSDGYQPAYGVMEGEGDSVRIKTKDGKADDLVLMDIDEQLYQKVLWDNDEYAKSLVRRGEEEFKDAADQAGVATFEAGSDVDQRSVETPRSRARRAALGQGE